MRIIYQRQLPGKPPKETVIQGWLAALIAGLGAAAVIALSLILFPIFLIGALIVLGSLLFLVLGGWLYIALRIGFRNMWDITKVFLGIGLGKLSLEERWSRLMKEWDDRRKGRPGVWSR